MVRYMQYFELRLYFFIFLIDLKKCSMRLPCAVKFREFAKEAFGIDFSSSPPALNENIVDWKQEAS